MLKNMNGGKISTENNVPIAKRVTRASAKLAGTSEMAATGAPRQGLVDHKNIHQPKNADKKVLMTKQEAKKLVPVVKNIDGEREGKQCKENIANDARHPHAYSASRFDDVVVHCVDYADDITDYMFFVEEKEGLKEDFLRGHEVNSKMRSILVDWLVQVHQRFHLLPETLYGAVNLLDRYLSLGLGEKASLQLVGVTCLSISAKYEEIFPPELQDFVYITENSISKKDIIRMEIKVLSSLDVKLGRPCALQFVRRLSVNFSPSVHALAKYISESAICDYSTCHLLPSVIAAVSIWLAVVLKEHDYPTAFYQFARVSKEVVHSLAPTFSKILLKEQGNTKLVAIRGKYSSLKNAQVAVLSPSQLAELEKISKNDKQSMRSLP